MESTVRQRRGAGQIHDIIGLNSSQTTDSSRSAERDKHAGYLKVGRYRDSETSPQQGRADNIGLEEATAENKDPPSGCQVVAGFIASDSCLFVYRRFGVLAARRLAMLQLELSGLERELKLLDKEAKKPDDLLSKIDNKLTTYHRALLLQSRICSLEDASQEVVTSLRNWYEGENPVDEEEYEYLNHPDDLVALAGKESSKDWLQKFLERKFATWYPLRVRSKVYKSDKITAYSEEAAAKLSRVTLTVSMLLLMVVTILVLGFLNSYYTRLAFAVVTLVVFSAALSLTSARASDIIVATAGYASVMGAFLQKGS